MNWGATSGEARLSKANGSLMRATPCILYLLVLINSITIVGIFAHKLPASQIATLAKRDNNITHPHVTCGDCVACYSIAIAHLINHPGDNR